MTTKKLSKTEGMKTLGVGGRNVRNGTIHADEFLPELRGRNAIRKYREMRDNDSTIGAVMYATEQVLRDVKFEVKPSIKGDAKAIKEAKFVEEVLEDMDHTLDDHISEALSFLTFGFMAFETVYKRRIGPYERSLKKRSKYSDGRMGIRKISARAPWTIDKFKEVEGEYFGFYQSVSSDYNNKYIPLTKSIIYRTTSINGDITGRSVLRNAYTAYTRLNTVQQYEAIGIERELAGIPCAEIPSQYLSPDATEDQVAFKNNLESILTDFKFNEQAYLMLPSDTYPDKDGAPTNQKLVTIRLMSSDGTRNIDIDPVVKRYQHEIARSVLSEFLMLGGGSNGSYALSKSKTDLFLRTLESYIQTIVEVLNKQLVESLWRINGLDFKYLPKIVAGDVAPHDLKEIAAFLRNLNGADINVSEQPEVVSDLMDIAELDFDVESYKENQERNREPEVVPDPKEGEVSKVHSLQEEVLKASLEYLRDE